MIINPSTVGNSSIPLKQNKSNNQSSVVMGAPFKPANMTQGNAFSMSRALYNKNIVQNMDGIGKSNPNNSDFKKKWYGSSGNLSSSQYIGLKNIESNGKSSTNKVNTQNFSFSGPDQTTVKSALLRCRGGGTVSPKKKGAY